MILSTDIIQNLYIEKCAKMKEDIEYNPVQKRILAKENPSMIFAHAVGSGKTLSSIAKAEKLKANGQAQKVLAVTPASLRNNFADEGIKKFTDNSVNIIGNKGEIAKGFACKPNPDADYNVVSYEMFRRNPKKIMEETGADTIIADEMHRLKNDRTSTLDAFHDADYNNIIGLSGSLISNKISDIYNLVDLASKGKHNLGKTKKDFEERFLIRDNSSRYRGLAEARKPVIGFKNEKLLRSELQKYIDYAGMDDIREMAQIPEKNLHVIKVPITDRQAKMYKKIVRENPKMMQLIKNKRLETLKDDELASAFSTMIESRKLMNNPGAVVEMSDEDAFENAPKAKRLLSDLEKHLAKTPDGQAILMTHLINGGADILEKGLKQNGVEYGRFLGKGNNNITEQSRQQDVNDYNDRKKKVMIISDAGGEGLSLGDTTFEGVLDGHYNPERMNQMEARGIRSHGLSHREKPDRSVIVNRYVATMPKTLGIFNSGYRTPDEMVYDIANRKEKQNRLLYDLLKDINKKNGDK